LENWFDGLVDPPPAAPRDNTRARSAAQDRARKLPQRTVKADVPGRKPYRPATLREQAGAVVRQILKDAVRHPARTIAENAPVSGGFFAAKDGMQAAADGNDVGVIASLASAIPGMAAARRGAKAARKLTQFAEVDPARFHEQLTAFSKARPSEAGFITWRTPEAMQAEGMRTFLSPDGRTGYAIHPGSGDIRNVFNFGEKGLGAHAVAEALSAERGGKILDAYDTNLGDFYRDFGFAETSREGWDPKWRPATWDDKYGTPDIVYMAHPEAGAASPEDLLARYEATRAARKRAASPLQAVRGDGPRTVPGRVLDRERVAAETKDGVSTIRTRPRNPHQTPFEVDWDAVKRVGEENARAADEAAFRAQFSVEAGGGAVPQETTYQVLDDFGRVAYETADQQEALAGAAEIGLGPDRVRAAGPDGFGAGAPRVLPAAAAAPAPSPGFEHTRPPIGAFPAQRDIPRLVKPKVAQERVDDVEAEALKTYLSPSFLKWLQQGGFERWYDSRGTEQMAVDALGDAEGPDAYRRLMEMMGAVTARSDPPNNLRRAQYYRGLELAGLLSPEDLATQGYKEVAPGMGHLANNAHHAGLGRLLADGATDPLQNPKPAGFVENLLRNFHPYTNDTRMATGTAMANPRMLDIGAIIKSVGKDGGVTYSPRDWAYAPMERAFQQAAREYAGRGLLEVPDGASPTAFGQAKIWDGLAPEIPGSSPSQGIFDDVFKSKVDKMAKLWGLTPAEANRLIWEGHPIDLPLTADVIPRGLLSRW
jgi:hypothetical protein